MTAKLAAHEIVAASVTGLGYELVDFEHSARGVMRVFIDKPGGIGVEDCASVSNHLTRVFAVESVEFERLEVSSPGLDRPLKVLMHYQDYVGRLVRVRLNTLVEGRKRFDGLIAALEGNVIVFTLVGDEAVTKQAGKPNGPAKPKRNGALSGDVKQIRVPFDCIDKTRLIPDF